MPRWQNLDNPKQEKFIRGYSVYPDGGCAGFPSYFDDIEGFRQRFKREIKRRYPTPVSFYIQAPTQRSDANYVDIDPEVKDMYGIPAARLHFQWDREYAAYVGARQASLPGSAACQRGRVPWRG